MHLSRGLVGWSQVVWLGNGHKAVTVQGPRRPLLRSVLCSILILGLLPPPPVVDQPLTSSPTSPTTALQRPTSPSTVLQRPGCSQNCSSSLSLLLPARTSIFASTDFFVLWHQISKPLALCLTPSTLVVQRERVSLYVRRPQLCLLWEVDPPRQVWGSFALQHEGVNIFFIRQNQRKLAPKGQRSSSCCRDYLWIKFLWSILNRKPGECSCEKLHRSKPVVWAALYGPGDNSYSLNIEAWERNQTFCSAFEPKILS